MRALVAVAAGVAAVVAGLGVAAVALPAAPALACTAPAGSPARPGPGERAVLAPIVIEGTVLSVTGEEYEASRTATVQVMRYLKGAGPATVTVTRLGPEGICLSNAFAGDHLVFFASGDPASGLTAFYASQFDATAPPTAEVIAEIMTALGQPGEAPSVSPDTTTVTPVAPRPPGTGSGTSDDGDGIRFVVGSMVAIALGAAGGLAIFGMRRTS